MPGPPAAGTRMTTKLSAPSGGAQLTAIDLLPGTANGFDRAGGVASYLSEIVLVPTFPAASVQLPGSCAVPSSGPEYVALLHATTPEVASVPWKLKTTGCVYQ